MSKSPENIFPNLYLTETTTEVSHSNFRAHFDGNSLFPQKIRVIRIYEACDVVIESTSGTNFQNIRNSKLSPAQLGEVIDEMNSNHEANRIVKYTSSSAEYQRAKEKSPQLGDKAILVPESRLQDLWQSDIDGVLRMLLQKTSYGSPLPRFEAINSGPIEMILAEDVEKITQFWQNPENYQTIGDMKKAAILISELLHGQRKDGLILHLSYIWQSAITRKKKEQGIAGAFHDDSTRKFIAETFGSSDQLNSEAMIQFLDNVDKLNIKPTDTSADNDTIFQWIKKAIESELQIAGLPLPFGLDYEKA